MQKEKRFFWALVVLIVILVTMPVIYGRLVAPKDHLFTGMQMWVPGDTFVYFSYLEQIKEGNWLFKNLYTPEEGKPILNIFWLLAGLISRIFNWPHWVTYTIVGVLFIVPLLYFIFYLVKHFLPAGNRLLAFLFVVLSSGLGFYYLILFGTEYNQELTAPMDLWAPEQTILLTILSAPHHIASTLLFFLILYLAYKAQTDSSFGKAFGAGFLALILFQFHPYYVPTVYGILSIFYFIQFFRSKTKHVWSSFSTLIIIVLISLPSIIYHLYLYMTDWIVFSRASHNILPLPEWHLFLISYGLLLPLAIIGCWLFIKEKKFDNKSLFLLTWFIVQGIIIISPIDWQRKLIQGWIFPMAILAFYSIYYLAAKVSNLSNKNALKLDRLLAILLLVIFFLPTSYYNLVRNYYFYNSVNSSPFFDYEYITYISRDRQNAYQWIKNNASDDDVILSLFTSGLMIPAYSGRRVYNGHETETILSKEEKIPLAKYFFMANVSNMWRKNFLIRNKIDYVWFGELERKDATFDPNQADFLKLTFHNTEVAIYKVNHLN